MKSLMYKILGWILRGLVRFIGRALYRLRVRGVKNIPSNQGALLVANHVSYMDFVLIVCSVPRFVRFVMNADVFKKPGLKWLLNGLNCIPISPRGGNNNFDAFNQAVTEQIGLGHVVMIFAEGTVTRTGQLLEFKKGVEHLSALIDAPVIPIHLHNVQGTPFTFRGGKTKIEKFSLKSIRREVLVNIGAPISGKITAFELRQKIKEMEVENFGLLLDKSKSIDQLLSDSLNKTCEGEWHTTDGRLSFNKLKSKLAAISVALKPLLSDDDRVGLLLPKNQDWYLLNLWLLMNNKTIVNINPDFTNEERYFVINKARIKTLITTMDLEFSRFSPNADRIIYTEHLHEAIEKGQKLNVICKRLNNFSNKVFSAFKTAKGLDESVTIIFERTKSEELKCISLSHRNLLSVIQGIRQVYFFQKGSGIMSNLPLHQSYGFVVEFLLPLLFDLKLSTVKDAINSEDFLQQMMEDKPSLVIATPKQLNAIAELTQVKNIPFLTHIFTADLHPDHHNIELLSERGIQVFVCAGMNETSSVFAVNLHHYVGKDISGKIMQQENNANDSIGKPLPGVAVKICDTQMNELPADCNGQIWIRGACITTNENHDLGCRPALTGGWFNTGIEGSINQKGFIQLIKN